MNPAGLCEQLVSATHACLEQGRALLGSARRLPVVEVRCDLRGRSAGQLRRHLNGRLEIRYNLQMAALQPEQFLRETVPHEAAHLLTWLLHGRRARPHGPQWQAVMHFLGVDSPRRCHDFRLEGPLRRQRRWPYRCDCRTHQLSTTRHKRAQGGTRYQCAACGGMLRAMEDESPKRGRD